MFDLTPGLLLLILFWFWSPVKANSVVVCSSSFDWSLNSYDQTPCEVAAHALEPCTGETPSVNALSDNMQYTGPATKTDANPCECNTVVYALFSACAACQGKKYISWSAWNAQCPEAFISSLPFGIPGNTSVPRWAFLNYAEENTFDAAKAQEWASKNVSDYYSTTTMTSTSTTSHTKSYATSLLSSSLSVSSIISRTRSSSSEPTMATTSLMPTSDTAPDIDNLSAARSRKLSTTAWAVIGIVVSFALIVGAALGIRVWRHWRLSASYKIVSTQYQAIPVHSRNNSTDPISRIPLALPVSRSGTLSSSIGYHGIVYTPSAHDSSISAAAESSNVLTEQNHHHVQESDSDGRGQWRYVPQ